MFLKIIGIICRFPARFASDSKSETGFGINAKNERKWRFYFFKYPYFILAPNLNRGNPTYYLPVLDSFRVGSEI